MLPGFSIQAFQKTLLGLYFFPPRLTGAVHHDLIRNILPDLLKGVDLQSEIHLWLIHDSAPPYFLLAVGRFLNKILLEKWIRTR